MHGKVFGENCCTNLILIIISPRCVIYEENVVSAGNPPHLLIGLEGNFFLTSLNVRSLAGISSEGIG